MTFVAVLAGGITLSISTCLNVWRGSQETAELNQEARAIHEVLARDIRGAYLGLNKTAGYLIGGPVEPGEGANDLLELCTESSAMAQAALLPEEAQQQWAEAFHPPVTDYVAVRYEVVRGSERDQSGLYRTTWVAPREDWVYAERVERTALGSELISESVVGLRFRYFDGAAWQVEWVSWPEGPMGPGRLPAAVSIEVTVRDSRGEDHVYRSIVEIPAR
jgi:hypothetical protein